MGGVSLQYSWNTGEGGQRWRNAGPGRVGSDFRDCIKMLEWIIGICQVSESQYLREERERGLNHYVEHDV